MTSTPVTRPNSQDVKIAIDNASHNVVNADGPCGLCDTNPAAGYAKINDTWYCHDDREGPDCYLTAQRALARMGDDPSEHGVPVEEAIRRMFGDDR